MRRTSVALLALAGLIVGSLAAGAQQPVERPRGFLGIMVDTEQADGKVVVREVTPDSPAAKAGLKPPDQIAKLNDAEVKSAEAFVQAVGGHKPGDKITLSVTRDGKEEKLTATLGERPRPELPRLPREFPRNFEPFVRQGGAFLGIQSQELTADLKAQLKVDADKGVIVTEVEPDSPAAKAGLRTDDVITGVGDKPVAHPDDLRKIIADAGAGKEVTFKVFRGKDKMDVKATLAEGSRFHAFPPGGFGRGAIEPIRPFTEGGGKIQELEKKLQDLEKRIQELEKKLEKK